MNNKLTLVAVLVAVICMMTSCLKDDSSTTQYDDVAVTAFTLGTLKKTVYTKNNGKDSTYTTTASCSGVRFTIDNVNNRIYNVDSLTRGIVTSKALVTVSTRNSAVAYLKSYVGDTLTYISSSDSLDFSQPRTMRVVANDGTWYKDYTVDVRVHQEPTDSVYWSAKTTTRTIALLYNIHAISFGGNIIAYGLNSKDNFAGYTSAINDGNSWAAMEAPFTAEASMVTDGTTLYACSAGKVYSTTDNANWTEQGTCNDIKKLVAATKTGLYAIANDGRMLMSVNGGASWSDDAMADSKTLMPTLDIQSVVTASTTNNDIVTVSVFGNTGAEADSTGVTWSKTIDYSSAAYSQPWQYHEIAADTYHKLPALTNLSVIPYAEGLIMMGGNGRGKCNKAAFTQFYRSKDCGLTWWKDTRFYFPDSFASSKDNFAFIVDSDNYMWILCGGTGQVWRGRLTQMAWTTK